MNNVLDLAAWDEYYSKENVPNLSDEDLLYWHNSPCHDEVYFTIAVRRELKKRGYDMSLYNLYEDDADVNYWMGR